MRIILRLVAGFTLLTVIGTIFLVLGMWSRGAIPLMLKSGVIGFLTVAGWAVTLIAGIPAVIFLWRPTDLGRIAAAIVWGSMGLYYAISISIFRSPGANYTRAVVYIAVSGALVALVLSPPARQASMPKSSQETGKANI